jgi:hypothetical protein
VAALRQRPERRPAQHVLRVPESHQVRQIRMPAAELPNLERSVGARQMFPEERLQADRLDLFPRPDFDRIVHPGQIDVPSPEFLRTG